jgi:uncharacterized protein (TIGR02246 family)
VFAISASLFIGCDKLSVNPNRTIPDAATTPEVPFAAITQGGQSVPKVERLTLGQDQDREPIDAFVQELQRAIDTGDADLFNLNFADDVLWGSPFGAVAVGYDQIHAIHSKMFASVVPVKGAVQYSVEYVRFPANDVAIAFVRRSSTNRSEAPTPDRPGAFDELGLFVLVQREGKWWLAAAQHVPDRRDVYNKP